MRRFVNTTRSAFTLVELLVVVSIIGLLISILMPSLSRARDQSKGAHCLARLKEYGNAIASYAATPDGALPPSEWEPDASDPTLKYGWCALLWRHVYREPVFDENRPIIDPSTAEPADYPVLRNIQGDRWVEYLLCSASPYREVSSGHYRVYLPSWAGCRAGDSLGAYDNLPTPDPRQTCSWSSIRPKLPVIGDANEVSARGDGLGFDDCSYIDAGEADFAGVAGNGNRFSDRHYGGTNYLFADSHANWDRGMRERLALDYDLNGVQDVDVAP